MSHPEPRLTDMLDELNQQQRSDVPEPTPEEILDYVDGHMEPAEEEAFRGRLALYPEAARRVSVLSDLESLEPGEEDGGPSVDLAALQHRLRDEGLLAEPAATPVRVAAPETAADDVPQAAALPFPGSTPSLGVHPAWRIAALLFLTTSVLLLLRSVVAPPDVPGVRPAGLWQVTAQESQNLRSGSVVVVDAGLSDQHTILLLGSKPAPVGAALEVEISGPGQDTIHVPITPGSSGIYSLVVTSGFLDPGDYELKLVAETPGGPRVLGTFALKWRR